MSRATTSIGEMVACIGIASARYELYERLAHKALQKCTPKQVRALLKELKIEQYERSMLKMSENLSNKTCNDCKHCENKQVIATCKHAGVISGDAPGNHCKLYYKSKDSEVAK